MFSRSRASIIALALLLLGPAKSAHAAANGAQVSGQVDLPPPASRRAPPIRGQGFVPRAKNPLRPPDGFDPRSEIVVVLDGGPVDDEDKKPRTKRYKIVGENFERDVLPVIVGGKVEIKNLAKKSLRLYSTASADTIPGDPISHKGGRLTETIDKAHKAIDVRDQDSVHFLAHIVAFEHGYFAVPDHDGKFTIEGVPPGTWRVKIWYRDGWVENLPKTTVTVGRRNTRVNVNLPAKLKTGN